VGHDTVEDGGVTPQLSACKRRSITTLNYIVGHNFQQNSNKENLNRMPYCAEYNTQTIEELYYDCHYNKREPEVSNPCICIV
jgi:hypothetical protein